MRRQLVGLAGAALLVLGSSAARADHSAFGHPVAKGDATAVEVQDNGDGTRQVEWLCTAVTEDAPVASTGVSCEVWQDKVQLDAAAGAGPLNAGATRPRTLTVPAGEYRICWTARSFGFDGDIVDGPPGCETFS